MNQHEASPPAEAAPVATAPEAEVAAPAPEPWTPERVSSWNAYYDLYVVLGVLLLVFLAASTRITASTIWTALRAGQLTAERGAPVTADPFSYTMEGRPW